MRFLSTADCVSWCSQHGIPVCDRSLPHLTEPDYHFVEIPFPRDSGKKVVVANFLYKLVTPAPELLLWLDDWAVFPSCQHMPLFSRFRQALGEERNLIESPGHLVIDTDKDDAISIIATSLLFFWDCHGLAGTGRDAFEISHDEYLWFASRDLETARHVRERVSKSKIFDRPSQ